MWLAFTILAWSAPYIVQQLERHTAVTTIRLWHELHVSRLLAHDFQDMVGGSHQGTHMGLIIHDEVRAIAHCCTKEETEEVQIRNIAHAPHQRFAGVHLVETLLTEHNMSMDFQKMRNQPLWYYEGLYRLMD